MLKYLCKACVWHTYASQKNNVRESFWPIIAHAFRGIFRWTKGLLCILNYNIKKLTYCTSSNIIVILYSAFQNLFCVKPLSFFSSQLPDKSIATLVKYYYSWKKTRSRTSLIDRQAKKMAVQKEPVKWVLSSWKPRLWKVILTVYKFIEGLPFYFGRKMFSFNRHPQRWRSDECLFYNLVLFCAYSIFLTTLLISFSTSDPESDNSDSSDSDFEPEKEVKFLQWCSFWLFTGSVTVILTHWMLFVYPKMTRQCNSALFTRKKNWKVIF